MQIIESVNEMQAAAVRWRTQGKLIGLVSTAGALHEGHDQLIEKAKEQSDIVVLSAFVNPKEFGPNEDYARFPRDREADIEKARATGVDCLFMPSVEEVYPAGFSCFASEEAVSTVMCGISRPHYFRGVCTYHAKLFNLVRPDVIVTGRRDAQKTTILRKLVEELNFPVEVLQEPTVRDHDGLPFNARNAYLNEFQRRDAVRIFEALTEGQKLMDSGIRSVDRVLAEVTHHITQNRRLRVIYVVAVDVVTMEPMREVIAGKTLIATAVWCDEVRLIDNILL